MIVKKPGRQPPVTNSRCLQKKNDQQNDQPSLDEDEDDEEVKPSLSCLSPQTKRQQHIVCVRLNVGFVKHYLSHKAVMMLQTTLEFKQSRNIL